MEDVPYIFPLSGLDSQMKLYIIHWHVTTISELLYMKSLRYFQVTFTKHSFNIKINFWILAGKKKNCLP